MTTSDLDPDALAKHIVGLAAVDAEISRQYRESDWEEAKDVIEGIDLDLVINAYLTARAPGVTETEK